MTPINYFANNLRFLCRKYGVTQEQLKFQVDKGQTTIGNWQNGKAEPSIAELLLLSNYFDIDLHTFIAEDIEKGNLITGEMVENFRVKGNLKGNLKRNLNPSNSSKKYELNDQSSELKDAGETTNWILLNGMRQIIEKLDQLQVSANQIKEITSQKKGNK